MVTTRFYTDNDYEDIKETLQEGDLYDEVREERSNLQRKIERDAESIIVAEDNGKIIGCVFIVEDGWNAFIRRLSVRKKYRKQGVGSLLMQQAETIIHQRGIKESSIFVSSNNTSLQQRYKKQDYIKTSDYTFLYKKLEKTEE